MRFRGEVITTENERRILGAIEKRGPLTKGELIDLLGVSWATVVKLVNRLVDQGLLARVGTAARELPAGKNSYLYDLTGHKPLAVGVDVEYCLTRLVLTNLRGEALASQSVPTSPAKGVEAFVTSLGAVIRAFVKSEAAGRGTLDGIGVAIPAFIVSSAGNIYDEVAKGLSARLPYRVTVENVVRAYTLYHARRLATTGSFIVTTVRTGIGCGIFLGGKLYRGESGLSGEISHLKVTPGGKLCRCGRRGCLETEVNENLLIEQALAIDSVRSAAGASDGPEPRRRLLAALFSRAARRDPEALAVVRRVAEKLAQAYAALLLTFDVSRIYLGGHFGKDGGVLVRLMRETLAHLLDRRFRCTISYRSIDDSGFLLGAALLALNGYLISPDTEAVPQRAENRGRGSPAPAAGDILLP